MVFPPYIAIRLPPPRSRSVHRTTYSLVSTLGLDPVGDFGRTTAAWGSSVRQLRSWTRTGHWLALLRWKESHSPQRRCRSATEGKLWKLRLSGGKRPRKKVNCTCPNNCVATRYIFASTKTMIYKQRWEHGFKILKKKTFFRLYIRTKRIFVKLVYTVTKFHPANTCRWQQPLHQYFWKRVLAGFQNATHIATRLSHVYNKQSNKVL